MMIAVRGQSTDVGYPTPVVSNEIAGRIVPRDLGDARLTRYFYAFAGKEGDLIITVESANLDGAVDLFTASTLRPLSKISLYAGTSSNKASKSVYLRREESLILRVEARAVGDAEGNFRVRFEGAFVASASAATPEPPAASSAETTRRDSGGGRRVTAVGARIPETEEEKAARLDAEAKERARSEAIAAAEKARRDAEAGEKERARLNKERLRLEERERRDAARAGAAATLNTRRDEALKAEARKAEARRDEARKAEAARRARPTEVVPEKTPAPVVSGSSSRTDRARAGAATRPSNPRGRTPRAKAPAVASKTTPPPAATATTPAKPAAVKPEQPAGAGARLIIETKDGSRLVREMSTVRSVTVEKNQIVVVGSDGKIERQPMTNVLRMSIEP